MSDKEIISALDEYYKEQQTKDVRSIISAIKSKRNLRKGYINYSQYLAEMIDKSINYTDYLAEQLHTTISYSEYTAEKIK